MTSTRSPVDWPGWARGAAYVAILLVLTLLAGLITVVVLVRRPLPQVEGTLQIPGLSRTVEVLRDERGIAQVYADTGEDLFLAQGFVTAQERFLEMDRRRHVASGRLSELIGEDGLRSDLTARTLGWRRIAELELDSLSEETRSHLQAYSDGVNAYLVGRSQSELSLEYSVLGLGGLDYQPERWSPLDTLIVLKAMAFDPQDAARDEVERSRLSLGRSPEQVAELYPRAVQPLEGDAWALSGEHTVSGRPLLATDPELTASVPGAWLQMGLHCRAVSEACPFEVSGLSLAGVPGVLAGHNGALAWGLTRTSADTTDLFLESVTGRTYLRDGRPVPLGERDEVIRVRGASSRTYTVRSTVHGPLLSDISAELSTVGANAQVSADAPDRGNGYAVAFSSTALQPRPTAEAILTLARATGWSDFREAAQGLGLPGFQLVYADRQGNIGAQDLGPLPARAPGRDGALPVAGWRPGNDWRDQPLLAESLPRTYNPPGGVVATGARVRDLLESAGGPLDAADLAAMQADSRHPAASLLMPYLSRQLMTSEYYADGQRLLARWDQQQPPDSAAAAYFNAVWSNLLRLTFHDQLPVSVRPDGGPRWVAVVANLLRDPRSPWWDDAGTEGVIEDRDAVVGEAMREARDELTRNLGVRPRTWSWGRLHRLELRSPVSEEGVGRFFDLGPYDSGGGTGAINGTSWDAAEGYAVLRAPVGRLVVDLDDPDRSRWVALPGASGHVWSGHHRDQVDAWLDGRSWRWRFSRKPLEETAASRLLLQPRS